MRRFVIGDIHGRLGALLEVFKACKFDYNNDKLIALGDIVDGGNESKQVLDELIKIKNIIVVLGNHDQWFMDFFNNNIAEELWIQQGGANTLKSYGGRITLKAGEVKAYVDTRDVVVPESHKNLLNNGVYYYKEDDVLFVHGGFDMDQGVEHTPNETLMWDRKLVQFAKNSYVRGGYKQIYVGHTSTQILHNTTGPIRWYNVLCLDTGAGWNGKLTIMNIDTEQIYQSVFQKLPVEIPK